MLDFVILSFLLGAGTAIVYPTFLSALSDFLHPDQRAKGIGVFRLWRDFGYAFGAICTIALTTVFDISINFLLVGLLTIISSFILKIRMT